MIKIPSSATRRYKGEGSVWATLVKRVDPRTSDAFRAFEGRFLKPGSWVAPDRLWPAGYPKVPILVEAAGITGFDAEGRPARGGYRRSTVLYLLWVFDAERSEWREIARSISDTSAWAIELAPIAVRVLRQASEVDLKPPNPRILAEQLATYLTNELEVLSVEDRALCAAVLHDRLGTWVCESDAIPVPPPPAIAPRVTLTLKPAKCPNCGRLHGFESGNFYCGRCLKFFRG